MSATGKTEARRASNPGGPLLILFAACASPRFKPGSKRAHAEDKSRSCGLFFRHVTAFQLRGAPLVPEHQARLPRLTGGVLVKPQGGKSDTQSIIIASSRKAIPAVARYALAPIDPAHDSP
jgi:hypothetical protein